MFAARHFEERRLGDIDIACVDQRTHLAVEERQQQRCDMGAVDISIGHDDDAVVTGLGGIAAFEIVRIVVRRRVAEAATDGFTERFDLFILLHAFDGGFLDVEDFTADGQDGLIA